jgi:hypothetical protein
MGRGGYQGDLVPVIEGQDWDVGGGHCDGGEGLRWWVAMFTLFETGYRR